MRSTASQRFGCRGAAQNEESYAEYTMNECYMADQKHPNNHLHRLENILRKGNLIEEHILVRLQLVRGGGDQFGQRPALRNVSEPELLRHLSIVATHLGHVLRVDHVVLRQITIDEQQLGCIVHMHAG